MQINDCIVEALGGGQINDLLLAYYQDHGAVSNNINDAEYQFLIGQGVVGTDHVNDMWLEFLKGSGYNGSLDDMLYEFWCVDGGGISPPGDVPSGYDFVWDTNPIVTHVTSVDVHLAEIGSNYAFRVTGAGDDPLLKSGLVTNPEFTIGNIDLTLFDNGILTGDLVLTNAVGSGLPVEHSVTLDIPPFDPNLITDPNNMNGADWETRDCVVSPVTYSATDQYGRVYQVIDVEPNAQYELSFDAYIDGGSAIGSDYRFRHSGAIEGSNSPIAGLDYAPGSFSVIATADVGGDSIEFGFQDNNASDFAFIHINNWSVIKVI